jgi:hypothetical protein
MDNLLTTTAEAAVNSAGAEQAPITNDFGAHVAPANAMSSDTIHSDDANAHAPIDASHLSMFSDASHLSACTVDTLVSTITEDSMLNPEPHQEPGMPCSEEKAETSSPSSVLIALPGAERPTISPQ